MERERRRFAAAILMLVTLVLVPASTAWAGVSDVLEAAKGTMTADRDVAFPADADCDLTTVDALAARHPDVRQFVVLSTAQFGDTTGEGFVATQRSSGDWVCQTSTVEGARFGRNGTRPLLDRRSGDGTTPAGVFPLGETTAWDGEPVNVFGNSPDPGVRSNVAYRDVRPEDCWGATPNDPDYNHLVDDPGCPGPDDEWLQRFGGVYSHAAVIGANLDPDTGNTSGDAPGETPYAAAIFLHRHSYGNGRTSGTSRPTSGCVSFPYADLVTTVNLLNPDLAPHFAIGPVSYLRTEA